MAWNLTTDFANTLWVEKHPTAIYVAKTGNDHNNGSPKSPVLTVARAADLARAAGYSALIIGSGGYSETTNLTSLGVIGDGLVEFNGYSAPILNSGYAYQASVSFRNVTIKNYAALHAGQQDGFVGLTNCILSNVLKITSSGLANLEAQSCLFINSLSQVSPSDDKSGSIGSGAANILVNKCTFINSPFRFGANLAGVNRTARNSYFDASSPFLAQASVNFSLVNCNVQSLIGADPVAAYQNNTGGIRPATWQVYGNVSAAPGFNNAAAADYTLSLDSAMRTGATDGSFIGCYGVSASFSGPADVDAAAPNGGLTNLVWNSSVGQFVLVDTTQKGSVEFKTKNLLRSWATDKAQLVGVEDALDKQTTDAALSYDADASGTAVDFGAGPFTSAQVGRIYWVKDYNSVFYNNVSYPTDSFIYVAAAVPFTTSGAGKLVLIKELPNIRTFEFKYDAVSPNAATFGYAQPWQSFIYGRVPTVDASGYANGHPLHNSATAAPVAAQYVKVRLTLYPNSLA